jgi:hypothetical protein
VAYLPVLWHTGKFRPPAPSRLPDVGSFSGHYYGIGEEMMSSAENFAKLAQGVEDELREAAEAGLAKGYALGLRDAATFLSHWARPKGLARQLAFVVGKLKARAKEEETSEKANAADRGWL